MMRKAGTVDDGSSIEGPLPSSVRNAERYTVITMERKELEVIIVDGPKAGPAIQWLVEKMDISANKSVNLLGLDTESVKRKVTLLQLSTYDRCVLVRLSKSSKIGSEIRDLLANKNISKAGAELYGDALDLIHDYDAFTHGLINLSQFYRFGDRQLGLRSMYEQEYKCTWIKEKKISCSNWGAQLSKEQIKYAALDAWVSYMVGVKVILKHESRPVHLSMEPMILRRLAVVNKQMWLMNDIQKRTIKVTGNAELLLGDAAQVTVRQTRFEKRVRSGNNVFAVTEAGEVKGRVGSTMGKTANFKMDKEIVGKVLEYTANNFNERDPTLEAQQNAITKILKNGQVISPLLWMLLNPQAPVRPLSVPSELPLALIGSLNPSQQSAVRKVIGNPLTLIHGPPGTGKTTTIACIAKCLTAAPYNEVIVITAKQNVAALNVLHSLMKRGVKGCALFVSADYYVEWHEDNYEDFLDTYVVVGSDFNPLRKWVHYNPGFEYPKVVICTTGSLTASSQTLLEILPNKFTTLMVDESSQMWLGELMPILETHKQLKRLAMVGDHKQLPPYGSQQMAEVKLDSISLFEKCVHEKRFEYELLNQQYRMPDSIGGFISKSFYEGGITTIHNTPLPACVSKLTSNRVLWVNTEGKEEKSLDTKSSYNIVEAAQVVHLVSYFTRFLREPQRVVVIVPYEEQRGRIEGMLQEIPHLKGLFKNQTIVYCIDGYQGREADIVVTSLVRRNHKGSLGFLKSLHRLNVMFSRAKVFMCVVGHAPTVNLSERKGIFLDLQSIAHHVTPKDLQLEVNSVTPLSSTYPIPTSQSLSVQTTIPASISRSTPKSSPHASAKSASTTSSSSSKKSKRTSSRTKLPAAHKSAVVSSHTAISTPTRHTPTASSSSTHKSKQIFTHKSKRISAHKSLHKISGASATSRSTRNSKTSIQTRPRAYRKSKVPSHTVPTSTTHSSTSTPSTTTTQRKPPPKATHSNPSRAPTAIFTPSQKTSTPTTLTPKAVSPSTHNSSRTAASTHTHNTPHKNPAKPSHKVSNPTKASTISATSHKSGQAQNTSHKKPAAPSHPKSTPPKQTPLLISTTAPNSGHTAHTHSHKSTPAPAHPTHAHISTSALADMFNRIDLAPNKPLDSASFWEFLCKNPKMKVPNLYHLRKIYKKSFLQNKKGPDFYIVLSVLRQAGHISYSTDAGTISYKMK